MSIKLKKSRRRSILLLMSSFVLLFCAMFASCGGEGPSNLDPLNVSETPATTDPIEKIILSSQYAGSLVVHFSEDLNVQFNEGVVSASLINNNANNSNDGDQLQLSKDVASSINSIIVNARTASLRSLSNLDAEKQAHRRAELEKLSGRKTPNLNSVVYIDTFDKAEALELYRAIKQIKGVSNVYAKRKYYPTSLSATPDLTPTQGYLFSAEENGGLNAKYAWDHGVKGENVTLMDGETDWDFYHEDLPFYNQPNLQYWIVGAMNCETPDAAPFCPASMNHGTAMVGIMAAKDNGHGVTGMAPNVDMFAAVALPLIYLTDGVGDTPDEELPPGSIFAVEFGTSGALSDPENGCSESQYGCLPLESLQDAFVAVQQAVAADIIVIEGAGNGEVSLDDPNVYYPSDVKLYEQDSGSIIVGASSGSGNHEKDFFSNCGSPVELFGWGGGVATTGYGYTNNPFTWVPVSGWPTPPNDGPHNYFINTASGTSSATAMVAGAAALVQSYAKQKLSQGLPTDTVKSRYLTPAKMKEILVNSGISQSGGGCNIGKQPRIDVAFGLVDTFMTQLDTNYPVLIDGDLLTQEERQSLHTAGVGIVCGQADISEHKVVGLTDPSCPEMDLFPAGNYVAKNMDFDGDGRADLVQWTNGVWKLDLSSKGSGGDNFRAWDVEVTYTPIVSKWVVPYASDMNSDGRVDFVVYDKENGKWFVKLTTSDILKNGGVQGWDWELDYSAEWKDDRKMDEWQSNYSRPAIGDYNGDGWNDIAISCSDGNWRIDYGGSGSEADFAGFEKIVKYLTDAQLQAAPGWAYLAMEYGYSQTRKTFPAFKVPDTLSEEGTVYIRMPPNYSITYNWLGFVTVNDFGGNDYIPLPGRFQESMVDGSISTKNLIGEWPVAEADFAYEMTEPFPLAGFGSKDCRPIVGDFDGDRFDDRAVKCSDEWRIAYSGDIFQTQEGFRVIPVEYSVNSLSGRTYSGGISYKKVKDVIALSKLVHPNDPPPIPVDMVNEVSE